MLCCRIEIEFDLLLSGKSMRCVKCCMRNSAVHQPMTENNLYFSTFRSARAIPLPRSVSVVKPVLKKWLLLLNERSRNLQVFLPRCVAYMNTVRNCVAGNDHREGFLMDVKANGNFFLKTMNNGTITMRYILVWKPN